VNSTPRYSVLEYVTLDLPFEQELTVFREGGAEGVGITEFTGPRGRNTSEMAEALVYSELQPTVCWPSIPSFLPLTLFGGPQDPGERTAEMCAGIKRLSAFHPVACGCVTGAHGEYSKREAREIVVNGLREAAHTADQVGVKLAIEPIHPTIADKFSIITTLQETVDLIEEVGAPNIGISFDVWHSWDQPDLVNQIREHAKRFVVVHVCDWRQPTRSWCDRLLPGDGIANVPAILGALEAAGYDGWYEIEILSDNGTYGNAFPDSLWNLAPVDLVRRGKEAFLRCWEARTVPS
jgi:sugar phosphate isomerase/epimerase